MKRREFMRTVMGLGAASLFARRGSTAPSDKPNILFILADDVGQENLGCYGGTSYPTPNLDGLAAKGIRFGHVYSEPVCHPSRMCLMTGQYPFRLGNPAWGSFPKRYEKQTFAHELKRAGYATAVAGKWQLCLLRKDLEQPHRLGFDEYCLFGWHEGPRYHKPHIWQNGKLRQDVEDRFGPDVYCDFLLDFMKRHRDRPVLAYFPMALCHDVSDDFEPPPPYGPGMDRYENLTEMMAHMDRIIGRLLEGVKALGLAEKTLVLFTTDNGTAAGTIIRHEGKKFIRERNVSKRNGVDVPGGKGKLTDGGTRVPTIACWPGKTPPGTVSDALIDFSDFLPTLNAVAGLPAPDFPINGRSFAPLLAGGKHTSRPWVYSEHRGRYWVRDARWKLYSDGKLFEPDRDPNEKRPIKVGADPAADEARKRLAAAMAKLRPPRTKGKKPQPRG